MKILCDCIVSSRLAAPRLAAPFLQWWIKSERIDRLIKIQVLAVTQSVYSCLSIIIGHESYTKVVQVQWYGREFSFLSSVHYGTRQEWLNLWFWTRRDSKNHSVNLQDKYHMRLKSLAIIIRLVVIVNIRTLYSQQRPLPPRAFSVSGSRLSLFVLVSVYQANLAS